MWLLKGSVTGLLVFVAVVVVYVRSAFAPSASNTAISVGVWRALTYGRPLFWFTLFLILCASCGVFKLLERAR